MSAPNLNLIKTHKPVVPRQSTDYFNLSDHTSTRQTNILRHPFLAIREAYPSHSQDAAHPIVEGEIKLLRIPKGDSLLGRFSFDGKDGSQIRRKEVRTKALELAKIGVSKLKEQVEKNPRVRKHLFRTVDKNSKKVLERSPEAELAIAKYSIPYDINVPKGSDVLAYGKYAPFGDISLKGDSLFTILQIQLAVFSVVSKMTPIATYLRRKVLSALAALKGLKVWEVGILLYGAKPNVWTSETFKAEASIRVFTTLSETFVQSTNSMGTGKYYKSRANTVTE
ncbi:hypothetical protein BGX21_008792 [Mortierella sp. AD011]|nr:hypothetical protein BGX20_008787 [Mortierella sp. AD010]KAF9397508.1 hypothetical protein BGX21_008792 [Mortierella sp. AD011]